MITTMNTLTPAEILAALANDDPTTIDEFSANLGSQSNIAQAQVVSWFCDAQCTREERPTTLTCNAAVTPITSQLMRACLHAAWEPSKVTNNVLLDEASPQLITRDIFYRALRNSIIPDSLIAAAIGVTINPQADSVKKFYTNKPALLPSTNLCDRSKVVCNLLTSLDISHEMNTPRDVREQAIAITNVLAILLNSDAQQNNFTEIPLLTECARKLKNNDANNFSVQEGVSGAECKQR